MEKHGFAKRTPIAKDSFVKGRKKKGSNKIVYHYTFSEFGTLNNRKDLSKEEQRPNENKLLKPSDESIQHLAELIENDYFTRKAIGFINWNDIEDFKSDINQFEQLIKRIADKIPHVQKTYIDEVKNSLRNYHTNNYPNSVKKKMDERIKQVVYIEQRTFNLSSIAGALDEAQNYWNRITSEYTKKQNDRRLDYETRLYDQLEEAYFDGDC